MCVYVVYYFAVCIVDIKWMYINIYVYQAYIRAYMLVFVHICLVNISAYQFKSKNYFWKTSVFENFFCFKIRSQAKTHLSAHASGNRSQNLPVPCNSTNQWANIAVNIIRLLCTYFCNMFISVYICLLVYPCIRVCMCALTVYILNQCVNDPYLSLYGLGAHPCGQDTGS